MGNLLNKIVFRPPTCSYTPSTFKFIQNKNGVFLPSAFIDRGKKKTILFSHGNAEDIGYIYSYFSAQSHIWGVNIFLYEYSGYGESGGAASEQNLYDDIEAAYNYLTNTLGILNENIIVYGRSVGSGPSVDLCYKISQKNKENIYNTNNNNNKAIGGLILQSAFTSIHRVKINTLFSLPGDLFCNIDKIDGIGCPLLLIHGSDDEVVPFSHSRELLYKYMEKETYVDTLWLDKAQHNNIERDYQNKLDISLSKFILKYDNNNNNNRNNKINNNNNNNNNNTNIIDEINNGIDNNNNEDNKNENKVISYHNKNKNYNINNKAVAKQYQRFYVKHTSMDNITSNIKEEKLKKMTRYNSSVNIYNNNNINNNIYITDAYQLTSRTHNSNVKLPKVYNR